MAIRNESDLRLGGLIAAACVATAVLLVALGGCAERRSPSDIDLKAHTPQWIQPTSADFHGLRVEAEGPGNCTGCHDVYSKGDPEVPACNDCHIGASGHPGGWVSRNSPNFHPNTVAASGTALCRNCHGSDYSGGWAGVACADCHAGGPNGHPAPWSGHSATWLEPTASDFHGLEVLVNGVDDCTRCHGFGLSGGTSGVACADCHGAAELTALQRSR